MGKGGVKNFAFFCYIICGRPPTALTETSIAGGKGVAAPPRTPGTALLRLSSLEILAIWASLTLHSYVGDGSATVDHGYSRN